MSDPAIPISKLELLALKKLSLITDALANSFRDQRAKTEQKALNSILFDVILRADSAHAKAKVTA